MRLPPRSLVVALALAIVLASVLAMAPRAAAIQNRPTWTAGDYWVYSDTDGSTFRAEIVGRENVATLLGNVYDAFHFRETTTSGSFSVTTDAWVRDTDLGLVRTSVTAFGITTNSTWDPPQARASFPLDVGKNWSLQLRFSFRVGNGDTFTVDATFAAQVENELDLAVPAGTFRCGSVRENTTGSYSKFYFSEQVGYWAKEERYDDQDQKTGERVLTEYRYQWPTTLLLIIGAIVSVIAVAVIGVLWRRRKKAAGPPEGLAPPAP